MAKSPVSITSRPKGARPTAKTPPASAKLARADAPAEPKRPFNPARFVSEVRAEARKISWTSRQETWITSVMVVIMVVITAVFFVVVDSLLGQGIQALLKFAA